MNSRQRRKAAKQRTAAAKQWHVERTARRPAAPTLEQATALIESMITKEPWMANFREDMRATCHDCAMHIGMEHEPGCDSARCTVCGGQWISCGCEGGERDVFTGLFAPALHKRALERKLYCRDFIVWPDGRREPVTRENGGLHRMLELRESRQATLDWHVPCAATDVGAHPDLNRASLEIQQSANR